MSTPTTTTTTTTTTTIASSTSKDILLSSEERYEIWNVKKEERPYLLEEQQVDDDDDDDDVAPLLDGCDIPEWRKHRFVPVSSYTQGILNVGSGCSMFRRESQLPTTIISTSSHHHHQSGGALTNKWNELQKQLLVPPKTTAIRIDVVNNQQQLLTEPYPWFERENIPAIIEGCTDDWRAMETCTWMNLLKEFGHYDWRFSDTHGACMTLETYTKYVRSIEGLTDDAPLAVYDSQLHMDERINLLNHYQVPKCFAGFDLFQDVLLEEEEEEESSNSSPPPPYRWILMGPARSGTGLHIDPLGTHAWVTIVEGCKRWVLFPPDTDQEAIGMQDPQIPSSIWFANFYPKVMPHHPNAVEVLQFPGETVYVPAGWPHLVLNLMDTVAITQNYATEYPSIDRLVNAVKEAEPELFQEWLPKLHKCRPDLFTQSLQHNDKKNIIPNNNNGETTTIILRGGGVVVEGVEDDEKKEG